MKKIIFATLLCLAAGLGLAAEPEFFAMDTGTKDEQHQTADEQVALIRDIGFPGIAPVYTDPAALSEMLLALDRHELKMYAVYLALRMDESEPFSPPDQGRDPAIEGAGHGHLAAHPELESQAIGSRWRRSDGAGVA